MQIGVQVLQDGWKASDCLPPSKNDQLLRQLPQEMCSALADLFPEEPAELVVLYLQNPTSPYGARG